MAKDARSTFEIIDDRGCPVDPAIFPRFRQVDTALESNYEAFRFTGKFTQTDHCSTLVLTEYKMSPDPSAAYRPKDDTL